MQWCVENMTFQVKASVLFVLQGTSNHSRIHWSQHTHTIHNPNITHYCLFIQYYELIILVLQVVVGLNNSHYFLEIKFKLMLNIMRTTSRIGETLHVIVQHMISDFKKYLEYSVVAFLCDEHNVKKFSTFWAL